MKVVIVHTPLYPKMIPPLGTAQIVAFLEQKGCQVEVLWMTADDKDISAATELFKSREVGRIVGQLKQYTGKWAEEILSHKPDFIAISMYKNSLITSILLGIELKSRSEVKIVVGGPETIHPHTQEMLLNEGFADYVVVREGEVGLGQIIDGNAKGKLLEHEVENLDALPLPVFKKSVLDAAIHKGILPYAFTRGCIGNCEFCTFRRVHGSFREKSMSRVREELNELKTKYGVDSFWFCDNILNYRKGVLRELAHTVADLQIYWGGYIRPDDIDIETCRILRSSGFLFARIGAETGSENVLRAMNKPTSINILKKTIRNLHESDINVRLSMILGHYSETPAEFRKTFDFLLEVQDYIDIFVPFAYSHPEIYGAKKVTLLDNQIIEKRIEVISMFSKRNGIFSDLFFIDPDYRNFHKKGPVRIFKKDLWLGGIYYADKNTPQKKMPECSCSDCMTYIKLESGVVKLCRYYGKGREPPPCKISDECYEVV